jgi:hypothetical protein
MAENKTKQTDKSVTAFLESVENKTKREDSFKLVELMQEITGEEPKMWGDTMVGFGKYHYKYASGREGDALMVGFSPRKQNLALYILAGFDEEEGLLNRLGKHSTGKSCLYVKKLSDIDMDVLREMVERSVKHMRETYPG